MNICKIFCSCAKIFMTSFDVLVAVFVREELLQLSKVTEFSWQEKNSEAEKCQVNTPFDVEILLSAFSVIVTSLYERVRWWYFIYYWPVSATENWWSASETRTTGPLYTWKFRIGITVAIFFSEMKSYGFDFLHLLKTRWRNVFKFRKRGNKKYSPTSPLQTRTLRSEDFTRQWPLLFVTN